MRTKAQVLAYMLVLILLLSGFPATAAGLSTDASEKVADASQVEDSGIFTYSREGLTYTFHSPTDDDISSLKETMGVKEDGRDYNLVVDGYGTGLAPPSEEEWD